MMPLTSVPDPERTAFIYTRVSTKEQAQGGGDADGFSLPAQRDACRRKAESLSAAVTAEFVDRGESARSADRPELQRMLKYIAAEPVDYVIVHKVDRLARNRSDDVAITAAIVASGAKLVSVTENIDETPSGLLLHGIMSSIAEFYSRNLASEVIKGTQQKVKAGGTPTRAPIGYRNVRQLIDGYEVRTVDIDAERSPLISWAFEQYASGDWTLRSLADELKARGLTFRPGPKTPAHDVPANKLHMILRNRYYLGYVTWRGIEYEGKHPPLVDASTFEQVQRVLSDHRTAGERPSKRGHYLVGSLRCGGCGEKLVYTVSIGRERREYGYFYCTSRINRAHCGQRYLPAALIERAVEDQWLLETVPAEDLALLGQALAVDLRGQEQQADAVRADLQRQIQAIKRERFKWAEKAMSEAVPDDIAAAKQKQLASQLLSRGTELNQQVRLGGVHGKALNQVLALIADAGQTYLAADGPLRRSMNQAWFDHLYVTEDDGLLRVSEARHNQLGKAVRLTIAARAETDRNNKRRQSDSDGVDRAYVSNFELLVELRGLEPLTPSMPWRCATSCATAPCEPLARIPNGSS